MAPTEVWCQPSLLSFMPQQLDWHTRNNSNIRMATVPSLDQSRQRQPWSMNDLSSELLVLIFEQLHDIDSRSLASARLLSKRFDAIITPIKYEHLRLTEQILATESQNYFPVALEKIYAHTRHVQANSDLDPRSIKRLLDRVRRLLTVRNLETFFYQDRGQGTRFTFLRDEILPAFKELVLRSYDWSHTASDVEAHWDFSRIRLLKLIDVPIFEFLRSVPFDKLVDLHTLHCDDFSAHLVDRRHDATRGLLLLVKQIRALHTLAITCHTQHFPIDGFLSHAASLQVLRFRDHVGFSEEDRRCPTMWAADLHTLSQRLVNLHTIELDMDTAYCDPPLFLRALCNFPQLHTLTLHVQTVLRALEVVHPDVDRDYDAAMHAFNTLLRDKSGTPWRSMTINVGGWKRHMVRRLSAPWRAQNARGVYAERCFVLERGTSGVMTLREEMVINA
ncbi:F-box domain-containing protein-like protein [Seiridium cupressi]